MIMRPIKSRGKNLKGEWEYGYYLEFELCDGEGRCSYIKKDGCQPIKIIPETVGQFTGLLDKNGTEIYENDIVSVNDFSSAYSSPYIGKVIMRAGQWCVEYYKEYRCCPPLFFDDFADRKTEVIGNIYDNPRITDRR